MRADLHCFYSTAMETCAEVFLICTGRGFVPLEKCLLLFCDLDDKTGQ